MLDSIRRGQRWLTLLFVSVIGVVFVFFMGVGGGFGRGSRPSGNAVVELGDVRLEVSDFQRIRAQQEARYREQLGDQFDADATRAFLDSQALRSLVEAVVLADSARELGLHVSLEELQRLVRSSPSFQNESGKFDRQAFESFASYEYGSQRVFLEIVRRDLLRQKMIGLLYSQASISQAEAREAALYQLEEVRVAYVALDTDQLPAGEELGDEEVQAYLDAHGDELQARYDERLAEFQIPEKAHARHILIQLGTDASDEAVAEAHKKAQEARGRIVAGESFDQVAREMSEDAGSKEAGGDLGFFARGENAPTLEQAAFALEPGDLSDVIRSDFGLHVVRVEAREPASTRPFQEVGLELARAAAEATAAEERARELAEQLAAAVRSGESLEQAARARELTLERTGTLHRRPDGFVPGLGGSPELLGTAFILTPEAASSPRIFDVGSRLVLIQLLERKVPSEEDLAEAILAQAEALLDEKRNRLIQDWIDTRREKLAASGRLLINPDLVISDS